MGAKREEVMLPEREAQDRLSRSRPTLGAWYLQGAQRVHKVTIIPRGRSLGSTHIVPSEGSGKHFRVRDSRSVGRILLAGRRPNA